MREFNLDYVKINPSGNTTILVKTPFDKELYPIVAESIMDVDKTCEQVGFIENNQGQKSLQMMGGEFCGNATMAMAVWLAESEGKQELDTELEVSGAEDDVPVKAYKTEDGWKAEVSMPLPLAVKGYKLNRYKVPVVRFPGIAHAIMEERMPSALAKMLIREWHEKMRTEAFGIMLMSGDGSMQPIVYVKSTDTVVSEGSCASGTAAVAVYEAMKNKSDVDMVIKQPDGELEVKASVSSGIVTEIILCGNVSIIEEGHMDVAEKIHIVKKD